MRISMPRKPKYYVLDMFPYPSGAGLHVGHPEGYTATDIIGRYKRMRGFNVLHPMGWDAFGLPAEQYAIKTGQHPAITTAANIANFRRQLKSLGFGYDWDREIATTDPGIRALDAVDFPPALQLVFLTRRPARRKPVPSSKPRAGPATDRRRPPRLRRRHAGLVVARNSAPCWRTRKSTSGKSKGHTVERRPMRQWMLRITAYAQRLIDELDGLDWPEGIKLLQQNWIGRSEGAEVHFNVSADSNRKPITVFTTRPDTLFGATYMVLAPEHPLVGNHHRRAEGRRREYRKACAQVRPGPQRSEQGKVRRLHRRLRDQSRERRADPDLDRRLRADGLRHRRDHGRACA